jgi:hypothetical protein
MNSLTFGIVCFFVFALLFLLPFFSYLFIRSFVCGFLWVPIN